MDQAEQVVKRLMAALKCSVCGSRYGSGDVSVLGHQDELWFLTVSCGKCHTKGLVAALLKSSAKADSASTPATASTKGDAAKQAAELDRARHPARVTCDDVLDIHQFLEGFDGDFARLFSK